MMMMMMMINEAWNQLEGPKSLASSCVHSRVVVGVGLRLWLASRWRLLGARWERSSWSWRSSSLTWDPVSCRRRRSSRGLAGGCTFSGASLDYERIWWRICSRRIDTGRLMNDSSYDCLASTCSHTDNHNWHT